MALCDPTLKSLGFLFTVNGIHHKLNTILKYADVTIKATSGGKVTIKGKDG